MCLPPGAISLQSRWVPGGYPSSVPPPCSSPPPSDHAPVAPADLPASPSSQRPQDGSRKQQQLGKHPVAPPCPGAHRCCCAGCHSVLSLPSLPVRGLGSSLIKNNGSDLLCPCV